MRETGEFTARLKEMYQNRVIMLSVWSVVTPAAISLLILSAIKSPEQILRPSVVTAIFKIRLFLRRAQGMLLLRLFRCWKTVSKLITGGLPA